MTNDWDEVAADWDSNKDVILYNEKAFESLLKFIPVDGLNILDFGCGTGLLTEKLSPTANAIVALDNSSQMIAVLDNKKINNVRTVPKLLSKKLIKENQFLQKKFDLIIASSVCSFLPDFQSTLLLLKSLLADDGYFVQWDWLSSANKPDFGLNMDAIKSNYRQASLSTIAVSQPFSIISSENTLPVVMGVARNNKHRYVN